MSRPGDHTPKFVTGDSGSEPILTYINTTVVPTTPAPTSAPATEAPITPFPGVTSLGTRIAASISYRPSQRKLIMRCWAELENKQIGTRALQAGACLLELIAENGGGVSVAGTFDAIDFRHVVFTVHNFTPELGQAYLARVTLITANGETIGPRTFGLPVN